MARQATQYEKIIFDTIKECGVGFYYENISKVFDHEDFNVKVVKQKEEMIGKAHVKLGEGDSIEYDVKYNRIVNLKDGYTMIVPGMKAG